MSTLTLVAGVGTGRPMRPRGDRHVATPTAPLRLTRRGRFVVVLLGLAMVLVTSLVATQATAGGPVGAPEVERYVVAPGDTLWEIATGLARPGEDVRDVVHEIEQLNRMPSATLLAGQEILLPADR